jgi:hypothetical protein
MLRLRSLRLSISQRLKSRQLKSRFLLIVLCSLFSSASLARSFDINLSDSAAQFRYSSLVGATNYGRTEMTLGVLYNEDDNYLAEVALLVIDEAGTKTPGLELGVGPKLWIGGSDNSDVEIGGIGLGGQVRYKNLNSPRIIYGASLFYSPDIVAFLDAETILEYDIRIEYELLPTANVYLGYRNIESDIKNRKNVEIDESVIIGLRFKF